MKASAPKESRGKKITRRLVVASAAAILTVYVAGYAATQSAAAQLAGPASPVAQTLTSSGSSAATSVPGVTSILAATATRVSIATATNVPTATVTSSAYKDGTYIGTGTSRHGSIQ